MRKDISLKVINSWAKPESNIVATRIATVFAGIEGIIHIELWSEDDLPFIEIVTNTIIQPAQVLTWGAQLDSAAQAEIYFHRLTGFATIFLLKSALLADSSENFDNDRADDYGIPLLALAQAWSQHAVLNETEQLAEERAIMEIFKHEK